MQFRYTPCSCVLTAGTDVKTFADRVANPCCLAQTSPGWLACTSLSMDILLPLGMHTRLPGFCNLGIIVR